MLYYAVLGSNWGPRVSTLKRALESLADPEQKIHIEGVSCAWEGQDGHQSFAPYINLAVAFSTDRPIHELRVLCRYIEQQNGRVRHGDRAVPVALDIDLVLSEDNQKLHELTQKNLILPYTAVPLYDVATPRLGGWLGEQLKERGNNWEAMRSRLWMIAEPDDMWPLVFAKTSLPVQRVGASA